MENVKKKGISGKAFTILLVVVLLTLLLGSMVAVKAAQEKKNDKENVKLANGKAVSDFISPTDASVYVSPKKNFTQSGKYGNISFKNQNGLGSKLADISLISNECSVIHCVSEGETTLYQSAQLFTDVTAKDTFGRKKHPKNFQFYLFIDTNESIVNPTYSVTCSTVTNSSGSFQTCPSVQNGTETIIKVKTYKIPYNYEVLPAGTYHWSIEGDKQVNTPIDWIPAVFETNLTEWAWWNSTWQQKMPIYFNETAGNNLDAYTAIFNITYNSKMMTNFSDVCFVNEAETAELPSWLGNYTASDTAPFFVNITNVSAFQNRTFWLYYNSTSICSRNKNTALNIINGTTAQPALASTSSVSDRRGYQVQASGNQWVIGIGKVGASTATHGYYVNNSVIDSQNYINAVCHTGGTNTCMFYAPVNISSKNSSFIMDANGGSYTQAYTAGFGTFPQAAGDLQITRWFTENANVRNYYYINQTNNKITFGAEENAPPSDVIPPNVSIVYPANTTYNVNVSQLNYTRSADCAFSHYSRDNGVTNSTSSATCANFTNVLSIQGSNNWTVFTNDSNGNMNSSTVFFVVDTVAPAIDFGAGTQNSNVFISRNWVWVNITSSDGTTGLQNITTGLYNSTHHLVVNVTGTASPNTTNFTGLADDRYYFNGTAYDKAVNANYTVTRNVTIDATTPNITITLTPYQEFTVNQFQLPVIVNFMAAGSDVNLDSNWYNVTKDGVAVNQYLNSTGNFSYAFQTAGTYVVTFSINDSAQNLNFTQGTVKIINSGSGSGGGSGSFSLVSASVTGNPNMTNGTQAQVQGNAATNFKQWINNIIQKYGWGIIIVVVIVIGFFVGGRKNAK